jgi:DNA-binding XRE family transcriptional regulator
MATTLNKNGKRSWKLALPDDPDKNRLQGLRKKLGMPQRVFARLVGISDRSLAKFEKGEPPSPPIERQVRGVARLLDAIGRVIRADQIGPWFQQPSDAFSGLTPLEVVERGEIDRIWAMIYELESGVPT